MAVALQSFYGYLSASKVTDRFWEDVKNGAIDMEFLAQWEIPAERWDSSSSTFLVGDWNATIPKPNGKYGYSAVYDRREGDILVVWSKTTKTTISGEVVYTLPPGYVKE